MTFIPIHVRARYKSPLLAGICALWLAALPGYAAQTAYPADISSAHVKTARGSAKKAAVRAQPAQFVLQNGMQVVVIPDARAPVVTHLLAIRSGASDDPAGLSGVAAFLAHMMEDDGAEDRADSFAASIARDGGTEHSETAQDYTLFWVKTGADKLGAVMTLEAERLNALRFGGARIENTSEQQLAARRRQILNNPHALAAEQARAALYMTHPYGIPVSGWNADIRHIGRTDAENFYKKHYAPNNAILIVVGDVKPAVVRALAEKSYGALPRQTLVRRSAYTMPPRLGPTRLTIARRGVRVPEILRIYRVDSYANAAPGEAEALEIAARLIEEDFTAHLSRLSGHILVRYNGWATDAGEFIIRATPRTGVRPEALEKALDARLRHFFSHSPRAVDMRRARAALKKQLLLRRDDPLATAQDYARALSVGLTLQDVREEGHRQDKVRAGDVHKVISAALTPEQSVTVTLTPGR